jgi:hypothetical protein
MYLHISVFLLFNAVSCYCNELILLYSVHLQMYNVGTTERGLSEVNWSQQAASCLLIYIPLPDCGPYIDLGLDKIKPTPSPPPLLRR